MQFDYPPKFSPGVIVTWIGNLNIILLKCYGMHKYAVNDISCAKAVLKHNEFIFFNTKMEDLQKDVDGM